jgi:hypothetical protein
MLLLGSIGTNCGGYPVDANPEPLLPLSEDKVVSSWVSGGRRADSRVVRREDISAGA